MEDYEAFTRKFFYQNPDIKRFSTAPVMSRVKVGFVQPLGHLIEAARNQARGS